MILERITLTIHLSTHKQDIPFPSNFIKQRKIMKFPVQPKERQQSGINAEQSLLRQSKIKKKQLIQKQQRDRETSAKESTLQSPLIRRSNPDLSPLQGRTLQDRHIDNLSFQLLGQGEAYLQHLSGGVPSSSSSSYPRPQDNNNNFNNNINNTTKDTTQNTTFFSFKQGSGWKPRRQHEMQHLSNHRPNQRPRPTSKNQIATLQEANDVLDRSQSLYMSDLPSDQTPQQLLKATSIDMHATFREAFSTCLAHLASQSTEQSFDLSSLLTRCWQDHVEVMFDMIQENEKDNQIKAQVALKEKQDMAATKNKNAILSTEESIQSPIIINDNNLNNTNNNNNHNKSTKPTDHLQKQMLSSIEEMHLHLASVRRLRSVMFDEQTRWMRQSDAEWKMKREQILESSYTAPDFTPNEIGKFGGYYSFTHENIEALISDLPKRWVWIKFENKGNRKFVHTRLIKCQALMRKSLAITKVNRLRMSVVRTLTRQSFEQHLNEVLVLSRDVTLSIKNPLEEENLTQHALTEVLWETRRLCRDISSMWFSQAKKTKTVEVKLKTNRRKARRTSMVAASMLEGVSMRATQLLEHLQQAKQRGGRGMDNDTHKKSIGSGSGNVGGDGGNDGQVEEEDEVSRLRRQRSKEQEKNRVKKRAMGGGGGGGRKNGRLKEVSAEEAEDALIQMSLKLGEQVDQQLNDTLMIVQKESRIVRLVDITTQTKISGKIKKHRGSSKDNNSSGGSSSKSHRNGKRQQRGKLDDNKNTKQKMPTNSNKQEENKNTEQQKQQDSKTEQKTEQESKAAPSNQLSMFANAFGGGGDIDSNSEASTKHTANASFMGMLRALSKFRKTKTKLPPERSTMSTILEIYLSKIPIDEQSDRDNVPRIDFGKYCYQFFYRRYGLRKLAESHLIGLNAAFKKYKRNARIRLFARCCGVFGALDSDCLDFLLYLISTIQQKDKDALEALEDGSCWMSETRALNLIRVAADTMSHSGPLILNTLERTVVSNSTDGTTTKDSKKSKGTLGKIEETTSPSDYDVLLEKMLTSLSNESISAHEIVENVSNALGGTGGSARKVIARLQSRPDFAQGIRHLIPLLKKLDQTSVDELLNLKSRPGSAINKPGTKEEEEKKIEIRNKKKLSLDIWIDKSPIELYLEFKNKDKENVNEVPSSPKSPNKTSKSPNKSPNRERTESMKSNNSEHQLAALSDAWVMANSQDNFLRGRDSHGISLDAVVIICLNSLLEIRSHAIQKLKLVFHNFEVSQHEKGKDKEVNGRCELNAWDFCMLIWEIDPTVSEGQARQLFEKCVDQTYKYDQKNGGRDGKVANRNANANTNDDEDEDEDSDNETEESVELDEITVRSFLKICMDAGMLRGWCQNYGKRPHTTGGAKVRVLEKSKALIRNVKLLSSLNPRQIHRLASEFKSKTYAMKEHIITEGEEGHAFYIIQSGSVDVLMKKNKKKELVSELEEGDFFGEKALLTNEPRNADCVASSSSVVVLVLSKDDFDAALGPLSSILEKGANAFSIMHRDWKDIHQPLVKIFLKEKELTLKARQQEYMTAEKEHKGYLMSLIGPATSVVKEVKQEMKLLEKLLKGRIETEAARKSITKLLLMVDAEISTKEEGGFDEDEDV